MFVVNIALLRKLGCGSYVGAGSLGLCWNYRILKMKVLSVSAVSALVKRLLSLAGVQHWDALWVADIWGRKKKELDWKPEGPCIWSHPCPQLTMPPLAWLDFLRTLKQVFNSMEKAKDHESQISKNLPWGRRKSICPRVDARDSISEGSREAGDRKNAHHTTFRQEIAGAALTEMLQWKFRLSKRQW